MNGEPQEFELLLARLDWDPANPAVNGAIAGLAARGRWKEAVGRTRAALRAGAEPLPLHLSLARGAMSAERPDRAVKALSGLSGESAGRKDVVEMHVKALLQLSRKREARVVLERYLLRHTYDHAAWNLRRKLLPGGPGYRSTDPLVSLRYAARLAKQGHLERAARLLRRMLHECPEEPTVQRSLVAVEKRLRAHGLMR